MVLSCLHKGPRWCPLLLSPGSFQERGSEDQWSAYMTSNPVLEALRCIPTVTNQLTNYIVCIKVKLNGQFYDIKQFLTSQLSIINLEFNINMRLYSQKIFRQLQSVEQNYVEVLKRLIKTNIFITNHKIRFVKLYLMS